ncbi:MAG: Cof-type HAD-IIB family hydrolase [Vulcanimicrobiaceae bacterium]
MATLRRRPRLVGMDLDGTLVGRDLTVRPRVVEALAKMRDAGIRGCIVTGRMYRAALPFARHLRLDAPLVCYQGAVVIDPNNDAVLFDRPLGSALVRELIEVTHADGMHLQLYRNDEFFVEERNGFAAHYARLAQIEPIVVASLTETFSRAEATKAVVIADPLDAQAYAARLQERFRGRAYVTRSYPEFVEVLDLTVNKGTAFAFVADHLGISMEETLAIGDGWNDHPLLQAAAFGVAMGDAPMELRSVADGVVGSVADDGVAEAIERFVLV